MRITLEGLKAEVSKAAIHPREGINRHVHYHDVTACHARIENSENPTLQNCKESRNDS
jgi:hypothetical protein